jgi:hypothetical protein
MWGAAANVLNEKLWRGNKGGPQAWVLSRVMLELMHAGSVKPVPKNLEYS